MSGAISTEFGTDATLGRDFLTWLWFRSETAGKFKADKGEEFFVFMEQHIVVQGGEGEMAETASVSGAMSELREVRLGLTTGKKVTRAQIRLDQGSESWRFTLKADDFSLSGFKTPKAEGGAEKEDNPEALFFDKMYLLEKGIFFLDAAFRFFLKLRLSNEWKAELKSLQAWMYP